MLNFEPQPIPDDITLGESRAYILSGNMLDKVSDAAGKALRLRFVSKPDDKDLPDDMTVGEFRALAAQGRAGIIVDDGSGGTPILTPPKPLVLA